MMSSGKAIHQNRHLIAGQNIVSSNLIKIFTLPFLNAKQDKIKIKYLYK